MSDNKGSCGLFTFDILYCIRIADISDYWLTVDSEVLFMEIDTESTWKLPQMSDNWGMYVYRHKLRKFETYTWTSEDFSSLMELSTLT